MILRPITRLSFVLLILFVSQAKSPARNALQSDLSTGSVCVSSVSKPADGPTSLANPAGGGRTFNYSVQIDNGLIEKVSTEKGTIISDLALQRKHQIKIRRDGRLVTSFWFTLEKQGSSRLCLWYKPLYETWSLWTAKEAGRKCGCK